MTRKRLAIAAIILALVCLAVWLGSSGVLRRREPARARAAGETPATARALNPRHRKPVDVRGMARGSLAGRVSRRDGGAVAGARVCASAWSSELAGEDRIEPICVDTGADGAYVMPDLLPASYWISASAVQLIPGRYQAAGERGSGADRVLLRAGEDRTGIDIVLSPGGVEVHGIVRDIGGGPIGGAEVSLSHRTRDAGWSLAHTADDGTFTTWAAPGELWAKASAPGYTEGWRMGVAPGMTLEILLTPESVIAGTVIEHGSGRPVARALVSVDGTSSGGFASESDGSAFTDAEGRFRITRLEPGRYKPEAEIAGGWGKARQSVLLGLGQTVEGVVIELHPALVVTGTIRIAGTGAPCAEGWLSLRDDAGGRYLSGWTEHRDGRIEIRAVLPGTYKVEVACEGHLAQKEYPDLAVDGEDVLDRVWEVGAGATIRGAVATPAGVPVPGASVSAEMIGGDPRGQRTEGWATADEDGRFEMAGLVAGRYRVKAESVGHVEPDQPIEVDVAATAQVDVAIVLGTGGDLHGAVVDQDGNPVSGATVRLEGDARASWRDTATTRDDGAFELQGIRAGSYRALAYRDLWRNEMRAPGTTDDDIQGTRVAIADGQVAQVRIVVENQSGRIRGKVVDTSGQPVTDAFVSAERQSDAAGASAGSAGRQGRWQWNVKPSLTDVDGKFVIDRLSPGTYTLRAYRRGGGEAVARDVPVGRDVTLSMEPVAAIAGSVSVPGGQPPTEFTIAVDDRKAGFSRREKFYRVDGQWAIEDLPAGTFSISVSSSLGNGGVTGVTLHSGERRAGVALELAARASVTGRVVALDTGKPLPGLHVHAQPVVGRGGGRWWGEADKQQITDGSGAFRIDSAAAARSYVVAYPVDDDGSLYGYARIVVELPPGKTTDVGDIKVPRRRLKQDTERAGDLGFTLKEMEPDIDPTRIVLEVAHVRPGGPAAAAGLAVGDIIVSVDGTDVRGAASFLYSTLAAVPAGDKLIFGLERGGTVEITAGPPS